MRKEKQEEIKELLAKSGAIMMMFAYIFSVISVVMTTVVIPIYNLVHWISESDWQILFYTVIVLSIAATAWISPKINERIG